MKTWVIHIDLDFFMAAVEIVRNPDLRGQPVIVGTGAEPTQARTVVATASYEARAHGVHSGMPIRAAMRACPDAVFIPRDLAFYEQASAQVMRVLRTFPVIVEVWGLDEAFLGWNGDGYDNDPFTLAHTIQQTLTEQTGLTCSVGIGDNKHQAKLAAAFDKPSGVNRLTSADWAHIMNERPVTALWGIGSRTAAKLATLGIDTVAHLAAADVDLLAKTFGPTNGPWLRYLALGKGEESVTDAPWVPRSRSHEITLADDVTDRATIDAHVDTLARTLAAETRDEGRTAVRVVVKIRLSSFFTRTRQAKLAQPTTDPDVIATTAVDLLDRFDLRRPVRLIGVAVEFAPLPR
ncbi:DNA polymerase IV [Nonomuraea soli]|uniref:DNA polymerase IV n=1 Tax=Nonomuraea soli TaxID=1032476 RepID=A0A7W0CRZ3_9ACTN|nr:DNA polymerase IV [Nonomuraea soli]MBA2896105.1 DNA polymerase-4 [Nonomuraea soli]